MDCNCGTTDLEITNVDEAIINAERILLICARYRYKNVVAKIKELSKATNIYKYVHMIVFNSYEMKAGKFDICIIDGEDGSINPDEAFKEVYPYLKENVGKFYIYKNE